MKTVIFDIKHPGEIGAGIYSFTDTVTVNIESGNPGGEEGEFEEHIMDVLCDWYDGAYVSIRKVPK